MKRKSDKKVAPDGTNRQPSKGILLQLEGGPHGGVTVRVGQEDPSYRKIPIPRRMPFKAGDYILFTDDQGKERYRWERDMERLGMMAGRSIKS